MKSVFVLIFCWTFLSIELATARTEESMRVEAEQVGLWEEKLAGSKGDSSQERLSNLWLGLRNMGYRRRGGDQSPAVNEVFEKLQNEMLAIPGHAQYFAYKIREEQKQVAPYATNVGPRVMYDFNRSIYFETLQYLPSPETIGVLGEFLEDDRDTSVPLISPDSDWGENPRANSFYSASTIMCIGLRDAPVPMDRKNKLSEYQLVKIRAWWQEVAAGNQAFSFLGQELEYRFNPDGTWETIGMVNPPNDQPHKATKVREVHHRSHLVGSAMEREPERVVPWFWIAGLLASSSGVISWLIYRRGRDNR